MTVRCAQCGAVEVTEADGSGTVTHADTCCYLAGVDAGHPVAGPAWIAECYGVETDQPCPEVKIDFPDWAPLLGAE